VESPEDIIIHLDSLRSAQEVYGGFTSFIPWSYKPDFTALRHRVRRWVGKEIYFRILAISRLYLDNFPHIGSSWFGEGKETGIASLHYGADDFGGTIIEENVHRATGFINKVDHSGIVQMIRESGFIPAQRNSFYEITKILDGDEEVAVPEAGRVKELDRVEVLYR